ncbi:hypothetical protein HAX54_048068, partial [Datura stramonium]|nr:hypothetical protein [Datura stramonium]
DSTKGTSSTLSFAFVRSTQFLSARCLPPFGGATSCLLVILSVLVLDFSLDPFIYLYAPRIIQEKLFTVKCWGSRGILLDLDKTSHLWIDKYVFHTEHLLRGASLMEEWNYGRKWPFSCLLFLSSTKGCVDISAFSS